VLGPWEDAVSEFVGRRLTLLWAERHAVDRGYRGGTVSLVSRASLERLGAESGVAEPVDGRRFRMLFEIDGVQAHEEDEWLGTQMRVGMATIVMIPSEGSPISTPSARSRAIGARGGTKRSHSASTARSSSRGGCAWATRYIARVLY
jgi:hypothetical protein